MNRRPHRGWSASLIAAASVAMTPSNASAQWATLRTDFRIDATAEDLSEVSSIAVSRDGRIVVAQPQDHQLRIFSSTGKPLARLGRNGAGPGEFRQLLRLGWKGDSLWVFDGVLGRVTLLTPAMTFGRNQFFTSASRTGDALTVTNLGPIQLLERDSVVAAGIASRLDTYFVAYVRSLSVGLSMRLVAEVPASRCQVNIRGHRFDDPSCVKPFAVAAPDGDRIAIVSATPEQFSRSAVTLQVIRSTGETVLKREIVMPSVPVRRAAFDSSFSRMLVANEVPVDVQTLARARIAAPKLRPAASEIRLGRDGTAWIGQGTESGMQWLILDRSGARLGMVRLPANQRVSAVSKDHVWVVETSEDGSESVVQLSVVRGK